MQWLFHAAIIAALTFAAYFNSLHTPFLFDDEVTIRHHKSVQSSTYPILSARGVTYNSYRGQTEPWHYHLVNVSLHAVNSVLVYAITGGSIWAGLFFTLHPIQTESVTYITGRAELLAAMFVLMGVYLCLKNRPYIALALYPLAMLSKESAIVMPILLWLMLRSKPQFKPWIWAIAVLVMLSCAGIWTMLNGAASFLTTIPASLTYLHAQLTVLLHYLGLTLWPTGQYQNADPIIHPTTISTIAGVAALAALSLGAIKAKSAPIRLGLLWFLIALAPTSSIVPIPDLMAEHRLYTPMIGVAMVFGSLFSRARGNV